MILLQASACHHLSKLILIFRYIEAEKQFLLINLKSKQMISVVQELNRHSRLEETIQGKTANQNQESMDSVLNLAVLPVSISKCQFQGI